MPSPHHHQDDDFQLAQRDHRLGQHHGALDDHLPEHGVDAAGVFEKSQEAPAFHRQLGQFRGAVQAQGAVAGGAAIGLGEALQPGQPLQRRGDVLLFEAGGGELAREHRGRRAGAGLVIGFEQID